MMNNVLVDADALSLDLRSGRPLLLAGDETILSTLPKGSWVGGTIPYFMAESGGRFTKSQIFVTRWPDWVELDSVRTYDADTISRVAQDAPDHGFTLLLIPATSRVHLEFAHRARSFEDLLLKPTVGWITGVDLAELGKRTAKAFDGTRAVGFDDRAVALHLRLPARKAARIAIVNVFRQGGGDTLTFDEDSFRVTSCRVNGAVRNFAEYLLERKVDTRFPLVADFSGAMINSSFQRIDESARAVDLYAPVFRGIEYRLAEPIVDYVKAFDEATASASVDPAFTCNCILNYLYGNLEGKRTGAFRGPITFGEIAYQLVNQTLVYLTIEDV